MHIVKLAKEAEYENDQGGVWKGGGRGPKADAPLHFLLFSPFPMAQDLMRVEGIMPSQQSTLVHQSPSMNHITETRGPPSSL